jgi:glycosyltransferase involved in cell wall biosynthesis
VRILYLVPYAPTPIRTRPYNLIRHLARRGHALTLATVWERPDERRALAELAGEGIEVIAARLARPRAAMNMLLAVASNQPLQAAYCWQPALVRALQPRLVPGAEQFDVIHVEHLRGARYGLHFKAQGLRLKSQDSSLKTQVSRPNPRFAPLRGQIARTPILWDSVDCISLLFEQAARNSRSGFGRWVTQFELGRTRRYEGRVARQFDRVLVTSESDKAAMEQLQTSNFKLQTAGRNARRSSQPPICPDRFATLSPWAKGLGVGHELTYGNSAPSNRTNRPNPYPQISVLSNGVDLDYFTPNDGPRSTDTVVLTGKMSYHANVTAALHLVEDIMPRVWAQRPEARVEIVGQAPPAEVRALAERHAPRVTVTGYVPDVRPHLWSAAVAAAPIVYGVGTQNKVLEAMACAAPVVATPQAVSALQTRAGEAVLVAEGAEGLAAEILRLLDDEALRRRLAEAGHRYVVQHHHWGTISAVLEEHYRELVGAAA